MFFKTTAKVAFYLEKEKSGINLMRLFSIFYTDSLQAINDEFCKVLIIRETGLLRAYQ
jgi:hypothetical protein